MIFALRFISLCRETFSSNIVASPVRRESWRMTSPPHMVNGHPVCGTRAVGALLLRWSVEINWWDNLLSFICWDQLSRFSAQLLILSARAIVEVICWLSRLSGEICCWDYLLTSADQPINQTINPASKQSRNKSHAPSIIKKTTHTAATVGLSAKPIKKPCTLHQAHKKKTNKTYIEQLIVVCLLKPSKVSCT